jgi:glycogen synthase
MMDKTIKVVPNGVNTSQFKMMNREKQKTWVAHTFGVDLSPDLNIINTGRLSHEKGISYLIEALEYLPPTTRLFLVGDGVQKDELKRLVKERDAGGQVAFLGKVGHEKLPELLNGMDVFVLPAIGMEGFSNAMLEAMACGLPVVTTTIGAGPEVVTDEIGAVVETKNPGQLADGIRRCSGLDRMVIRKYVEAHFSFDIVADYVYDMYARLCGKEVENICYCSLYAPPYQLSGAGMQVHELSKQLSRMCDVSVISTGTDGSQDEMMDGVHYYRVKYMKGEAMSRFCYSLLGSLKGISLDRFDVVDGRNWEGGLISVFLSKRKGSKSVMSFRGEGAVEGPWVKNRINRYIARRVDLMTATDRRTAEKAERVLN